MQKEGEKNVKKTHYDLLQVSPKALPTVIDAAYKNLKSILDEAASKGDHDARNELIFLEEAYSVLSSPEKRAAYDESLAPSPSVINNYQSNMAETYSFESESNFLNWWRDSKTARLFMGLGFFAAIFFAYKFMGQQGEQKIATKQVKVQANKDIGIIKNDAYRAENERILFQGAVHNQGKAIDSSYDVAAREAERRMKELEYRANAGSEILEMKRQQLEAERQQQKWAQEQHEKDRQMQQAQYDKDRQVREAQVVVNNEKRRLCNIYLSEGRYSEAQSAGCNR